MLWAKDKATILVEALKMKGITVATAESCTGGKVSGAITAIPGASDIFSLGITAYSPEIKTKVLGVDPDLLAEKTAYCKEVAEQMAEGVLKLANADIAVAISGLAGPDGGTEAIPVGTVFVGIATVGETSGYEYHFKGDRRDIRNQAVQKALSKVITVALDVF